MAPVAILYLLLRVLGSTKENAALQVLAPSPTDESYKLREERIFKESGIDRASILDQSQQVIQGTLDDIKETSCEESGKESKPTEHKFYVLQMKTTTRTGEFSVIAQHPTLSNKQSFWSRILKMKIDIIDLNGLRTKGYWQPNNSYDK